MLGLEKVADLFDEIHHDNQKAIRSGLQSWVTGTYQADGESAWFYGAAVTAGVAETLYDAAGFFGQGMVDLLRLGEGVKEGTVWGVTKDALRLVSVVSGGLRILRVGAAAVNVGGPMSCTISATAKGGILSGNGFRLAVMFDRFATMFGGRAAAASPAFSGTTTPMELKWLARLFGMRTTLRSGVTSVDEVAKLAAQGKGPVVFGVRWAGQAGTPGGGHTMVAFRDLFGRVVFTDQWGRLATSVGQIGPVASVYPEIMLIHDAMIIQALRWGAVGHFLAVPLFPVNPSAMKQLDADVHKRLGRPMPTATPAQPQAAPQGALPQGVLPPGARTNTTVIGGMPNSDQVGGPRIISQARFTYIVRPGESLRSLAAKFYGREDLFGVIFEANRAKLGGPAMRPERAVIHPGQELVIP